VASGDANGTVVISTGRGGNAPANGNATSRSAPTSQSTAHNGGLPSISTVIHGHTGSSSSGLHSSQATQHEQQQSQSASTVGVEIPAGG
jgi:hypothetical protein